MRRARHAHRTGLVTTAPQRTWRDVHAHSLVLLSQWVEGLRSDVAGLREGRQQAEAAAATAERRATRLEEQLAATSADVAALRRELTAVREELVWAFAEGRTAGAGPVALPAVRRAADAG